MAVRSGDDWNAYFAFDFVPRELLVGFSWAPRGREILLRTVKLRRDAGWSLDQPQLLR